MSVNQPELSVGSLEQRGNAHGEQQPSVEREEQRSQETKPRDSRERRLVHRGAILTGVCATVLVMVAWTAFLLYGVVWVVQVVA